MRAGVACRSLLLFSGIPTGYQPVRAAASSGRMVCPPQTSRSDGEEEYDHTGIGQVEQPEGVHTAGDVGGAGTREMAVSEFAELTRAARDSFQRLGIDTIPLMPGTDRPCSEAWPTRHPPQLWWEAPLDANIGVRLGGQAGLAVIEVNDDPLPGTADAITRHLSGLGYAEGDYPVVQPASQFRRQFYIRLADALDGCFQLAVGLSGTLLCGADAYVVAPPSRIAGNDYRLLTGRFERMPRLDAQDLLPIVSGLDAPYHHAPQPRIPHNVWRLLKVTAESGPDCRDIDVSIALSLVNAGHDYASVADFFQQHPPPQFRAILAETGPEGARRWLEVLYDEVMTRARDQLSFGREMAEIAREWAQRSAWPGSRRTLTVDRQVFLAHTELAYRCGRTVYSASCRELAELTGRYPKTIARANARLCRMGVVDRHSAWLGGLAALYRLGGYSNETKHRVWDGAKADYDWEQAIVNPDDRAEISTVCGLVQERGGIVVFRL